MYRPIVALVFVCLMSSVVAGQQDMPWKQLEIDAANNLNRLESVFMIANNGIYGSGVLEATEEQKESFEELKAERVNVQSTLADAVRDPNTASRVKKFEAILIAMADLEKKLTTEVLLPHQVETLRHKEFEHYLDRFKGDFARVINEFYGEKLNLTDEQKQRWLDLKKRAGRREEEASFGVPSKDGSD